MIFELNATLTQRKMVDLGKIFARVICTEYVLQLQQKGFRKDLVDNSIRMIQQEVGGLICAYHFDNTVGVVDDYLENSSWLDL